MQHKVSIKINFTNQNSINFTFKKKNNKKKSAFNYCILYLKILYNLKKKKP